jgi:hypothetical protein
MKVKVLVALLVALAATAVVLLVVWPRGLRRDGSDAGSGSGPKITIEPAPGSSTGGGPLKVVRPGTGGAGGTAVGMGSGTEPDPEYVRPDRGPDPTEPPNTAKLAAAATVRQRDLIKVQLAGLKERVPKLKGVLERLRKTGQGDPKALEQIQTQLQQAVDAIPRLERQLPELEEKVRNLPKFDKGVAPQPAP